MLVGVTVVADIGTIGGRVGCPGRANVMLLEVHC